MRIAHLLAAAAAAVATVLAMPGTSHADQLISQAFAVDSGDSCRYGIAEGALTWRFGPSTSPLPLAGVAVRGRLADRPLPTDPVLQCRDDGLFSVVTFTAFSGLHEVDREGARADNTVTSFQFALGDNTTVARIDRVVIQVCRHNASSVTPRYCGRAVEYRIPPVVIA